MIDGAEIISDFFVSLGGLPLTVVLVVVPMLIALPIGFCMAVITVRRTPLASQLSRVFVSFMRGTPIIVQIFLIYNAMPLGIDAAFKAIGAPINIWDINNLTYAITAFALSETAILAEVFRAALNGVEAGQFEAAECCGLTVPQAYVRIIVPQALTSALPVLANTTTELIKTTSLAFSMAISDVTGLAKIQGAASSDYFDAYLAVFVIYLVLVLACEQLFKLAERKANVARRVPAPAAAGAKRAEVEANHA